MWEFILHSEKCFFGTDAQCCTRGRPCWCSLHSRKTWHANAQVNGRTQYWDVSAAVLVACNSSEGKTFVCLFISLLEASPGFHKAYEAGNLFINICWVYLHLWFRVKYHTQPHFFLLLILRFCSSGSLFPLIPAWNFCFSDSFLKCFAVVHLFTSWSQPWLCISTMALCHFCLMRGLFSRLLSATMRAFCQRSCSVICCQGCFWLLWRLFSKVYKQCQAYLMFFWRFINCWCE